MLAKRRLEVAKRLSKQYEIRCHDPFVMIGILALPQKVVVADVLVILSNHKAYGSGSDRRCFRLTS